MAKYFSGVKLYDYGNRVDGEPIHYNESLGFCYHESDVKYVDKMTGIMLRPFTELRNDTTNIHIYDSSFSFSSDLTMSLLCEVFGRNSYPYGCIIPGELKFMWQDNCIIFSSEPLVLDSSDLIVYGIGIDPARRHNMHDMAKANGLIALAFEEININAVVMPISSAAKLLDHDADLFRNQLTANFRENTISFNAFHI